MRKINTLLLVLVLLVTSIPVVVYADNPTTGITWGVDITESISGNTLTLSGTGSMVDFAWGENTDKLSDLGITNVVVGEGIINVGSAAFMDNLLESVTLPNSLAYIGNMSFMSNALTVFIIPETVTTIGYSAFVANSLTAITIPASVLTIGDSAFFNNMITEITMERADTLLEDSLLNTGNNNFRNTYTVGGIGAYTGTQTGVWTKVVPLDTTTYDAKVLEVSNLVESDYTTESWISYTTAITLTDLTLDSSNTQEELDAEVIKIQEALELLSLTTGINWGANITESISGDTLTLSGTGVMTDFNADTNHTFLTPTYGITKVIIENGITSIGNFAFYDNEITSVTLPESLITIGMHSLRINNISSITIPNNVTNIGAMALGNNSLTSLTLSNSLAIIDDGAFYDNQLTSIVIPNSVTYIGETVLALNKLNTITMNRNNTTVRNNLLNFDNNNFKTAYEAGNAGTYTGAQTGDWTKVVLSDTTAYDAKVLEVSNLVESDYTTESWTSYTTDINLTDLTLDSSNTQEELDVEVIKIQEALELLVEKPIGTGITWGLDITESISGNTLTLSGTGPMLDFIETGNNNKLSNKSVKYIVIEEGITTIGEYAFASNELETVTLPSTLTKIGRNAFMTNKLTSMIIPGSVTTIDFAAFMSNNMTSITMEGSGVTIGSDLFGGGQDTYNSFKDAYETGGAGTYVGTQTGTISGTWTKQVTGTGITWGDNITESIDDNVLTLSGTGPMNNFNDSDNYSKLTTKGITEVIIGEGITTVGDHALRNIDLTSVTMPSTLETIGEYAFITNDLTQILIPNGVTVINSSAFRNNQLTSVIVPNSVIRIEYMAFTQNPITSITMERVNTNLEDNILLNNPNNFKDVYAAKGMGTYVYGYVESENQDLWTKELTDAEKLALDIASVQTEINNLVVTNSTTNSVMYGIGSSASSYATNVALLDFDKINATSTSTGSVTGTIRLTLNSEVEDVPFNKTIAQLPSPVVSATGFSLAESSAYNGVVSGEGDSLTYILQTGPQYGALTFNADGSFTYSAHRQATVGFLNSDTFTFSARDSGNQESNIATVSIAITPVNDAPVATLKSITANIGVETNRNVSATDVDGDELNYGLVTSPQYGTLIFNSDGSYCYTATDNTQTSDSFVFKANDGLVDSTNATVTITLVAAIDITAPILTAESVSRTSHTTGTVKFTSDEAGTYYYEVVADGATAPAIDTNGAGIACTTEETTISNPTGLTARAKDIYILVKDDAGNVSDVLKIDIPNYTSPNSGGSSSGGSSGGSSSSETTPPKDEPVIVIVNGEEQNAGKETKTFENGQSIVTITVDNKTVEDKVDEAIKNNKTYATNSIQVPVTDTTSEVAKVELTGDIIKKLEKNSFNISVKRDMVEYVIPAEEFAISSVAKNLDVLESNLVDIKLEVQITTLDDAVVKKFNEVAKANGSELVFPPVSFEVMAKTTKADGTTGQVVISKFNNYVQRVMEIPEGVDPKTVTTGVVFNKDGTYSHVPTTVYQKDGRWFASLNSLTNSNYSVIWNQVTVESVENHWAKLAVNDMASRLVIFEPEKFEPNQAITRADFAEYLVRALGVYRVDSIYENKFKDVTSSGDRTLAILIASEYGIVSGYADGTFKPDALISREEAMVMYQRAMKVTKLTGEDSNRYQNYKDFEAVSSWAVTSVKEVLAAHVFNGTDATTISPKSNLTYAEAAQAIKSLLVESKLIND